MQIERREIVDRNQWLEWRANYVGASESPALFDEHKYLTKLKLNVSKRGVDFPFDDNKVVRRGRWMEPAIGKAVAELRPDWKVIPATDFYCCEDPRMSATPDFYIEAPRGRGILQTKSAAWSVWHGDWYEGAEAPRGVLIQASQEALLADADFAACAVLLIDPHAMDCAIFEFDRNPVAEAKIVAAITEFWADIEAGREPAPNFAKDAETIKKMYSAETPGSVIDLTGNNHAPELLAERADLMAASKDIDKQINKIDAEVRHLLKDAESAQLPGWKITNKITEYKEYTVAARSSRVLRIYDKREKEMQP